MSTKSSISALLAVGVLAVLAGWVVLGVDGPSTEVEDEELSSGDELSRPRDPSLVGRGGETNKSPERTIDDLLAELQGDDEAKAFRAAVQLAERAHLPEREDLLEALLAFGSGEQLLRGGSELALRAIRKLGPWSVGVLGDAATTGAATARTRLAVAALAREAPHGIERLGNLLRTWDASVEDDCSRLVLAAAHLSAAPYGNSEAVGLLGRLVESPHFDVAAAALDAISRHGTAAMRESGAVQVVLDRAEVGSTLQVRAARALWHLTGDAQTVLGLIEDGPGDPFRSMTRGARVMAYQALAELGPLAVHPLEEFARRRVPGALSALGRIEPLPTASFRSLLTSETEAEQLIGLSGVRTLGARGSALKSDVLGMLDSPSSRVRIRALGALQAISGTDGGVASRVARALSDTDPQVRIAAARAFASSTAWTRMAHEQVEAALDDPALHVREYAKLALERVAEGSPR